jgi:hypothetical protein
MMETSLQLKKLNFVFWFFSFVCCATMKKVIETVIEKDKEKFRRLHLPKAKANELESNSNKRRRLLCSLTELGITECSPLGWVDGPLTDRRLFSDYAPNSGDVLEVVPRYDGLDAAVMSCEVVQAEGCDNQGVLAKLKFLGCDDKGQEQWSKDLVTRRNGGASHGFHFCQREMCTSGDDQTVHIRKWRFLTIDLDGVSTSTVSNGGSNTMPVPLIEMTEEIRSTMERANHNWQPLTGANARPVCLPVTAAPKSPPQEGVTGCIPLSPSSSVEKRSVDADPHHTTTSYDRCRK